MPSAAENCMTFEKQHLEYCPRKDRTLSYEVSIDHATGTVHYKLNFAGPAQS